MSRASLFQILQLAYGPSLTYTMGAFKIGQYFRTQLFGIPYHEDNRLIVEFLGNFALVGESQNSDMALVAGLAGYISGETQQSLGSFFGKIKKTGGFIYQSKIWPFTVDSDIIFNTQQTEAAQKDVIRFHLLNRDQKVLIQAEYVIIDNSFVLGPGSSENLPINNIENIDSFSAVLEICLEGNLSLFEYILSYEKQIHSIQFDQTKIRMDQIWKIVSNSIENGLVVEDKLSGQTERQAGRMKELFYNRLAKSEILGQEQASASIYAIAVCEEILDNQLVIAAPFCETSGIVAGVLKSIQQKYHFSDKRMSESLIIAAFIGSILLQSDSQIIKKEGTDMHFPIATAMACAGGLYLFSQDTDILNEAVKIAINLSDLHIPLKERDLISLNIKHTQLAIEAINLSLSGYQINEDPFDLHFIAQCTSHFAN